MNDELLFALKDLVLKIKKNERTKITVNFDWTMFISLA